jgi:radical SAM protein with 4Fe4S-binding SPASM domain
MDYLQLPVFTRKLIELTRNGFPSNAHVETTHRCQAGCGYCFLSDRHCAPELNTGILTGVIRKLNADGILYLSLTGGDPFIRPDILTILTTAFSLDFFGVSVFTSGYQLDGNHLDFLKSVKKQIPLMQMTVFSHIDEVHDRYVKVPGGLKKIIAAGRELLAAGVRVQIALPTMKFNLPSLPDTIAFLESEGFPVLPSLSKVITPQNCSPDLAYETSSEFFRRVFETVPAEKVQYLYSRYKRSCDPGADTDELCHGRRQSITIDNYGNLRPCSAFRHVSFGSYLNDTPLHALLAANKTYRYMLSLSKKDFACVSCVHRKFCNPCIGRWHSLSGSFLHPDEQSCNFTESFISHQREAACREAR